METETIGETEDCPGILEPEGEDPQSPSVAEILKRPLPVGHMAVKKATMYNGWEFNRPFTKPRNNDN